MAAPVIPYKDSASGKKEQVAVMFNNIAHRYDFLNQLLSAGIHKRWRKKAIRLLVSRQPSVMLDVATGTGDFAIEALTLNPTHVTGVDISEGMLAIGKKKIAEQHLQDKITLCAGDAEHLDFEDNTFDAITVGFGVRNFENLEKGLRNMNRVLKPGGTLVVLEFSRPRGSLIKPLYRFYFSVICPVMGRLFSKDSSAYRYLPESVNAFPDGDDFLKELAKTGYSQNRCLPLTFGIASIYIGTK